MPARHWPRAAEDVWHSLLVISKPEAHGWGQFTAPGAWVCPASEASWTGRWTGHPQRLLQPDAPKLSGTVASLGNKLLTAVTLDQTGTFDPIVDNQMLIPGNPTQVWVNPAPEQQTLSQSCLTKMSREVVLPGTEGRAPRHCVPIFWKQPQHLILSLQPRGRQPCGTALQSALPPSPREGPARNPSFPAVHTLN